MQEIDELNEEKKRIKPKMNKNFEKMQKLNEEIDVIKAQLGDLDTVKNKEKTNICKGVRGGGDNITKGIIKENYKRKLQREL